MRATASAAATRCSAAWLLFGATTIVVAGAHDVATLAVLRLLAGIGLGGAMPNAAALAAEYVPLRQRPFAVTPGHRLCARRRDAWRASRQSPHCHRRWRGLFIIGGATPIAARRFSPFVMPESPRFLVRHPVALAGAGRAADPHGASRLRRIRLRPARARRPAGARHLRRSSARDCASTPLRCGGRSFPACSPSIWGSRGCLRS
jgi:MFS family permease